MFGKSIDLLLATCALAASTGASAQLPSNSVPAILQDDRILVGSYRYVERADGMKIDVDLNADHTATYRIRAGADDVEFAEVKGLWTYDGDTLHIHNRPGPVRLEQAARPVRDPATGLRVTVTTADGSPAKGLGVTWPDANGLFAMADGSYAWAASETGAAKRFYVVRLADRKVLLEGALSANGPNSFRFTYHPSDVEPFDIPAIALDERADRLEVEVGTSYARLDRVR